MSNDFNPFLRPGIVIEKDVWDGDFPDFDELNAHVSQQVIESLRQVKGTFSIAITGEVGSGKSNIYSRIHHQLSENNEAFCIRINGDNIPSLDSINYHFLQFLIDGLSHPRKFGATHLQEIATAIFNEGMRSVKKFTSLELLEYFDEFIRNKKGEIQQNSIDRIIRNVQQSKPYLTDSSNLICALLLTLSAPKRKILKKEDDYLLPHARDWLRGDKIREDKAQIMKLPVQNFTEEDRESESHNKALQLIRMISDYTSLVICFDELDSIKAGKFGFTVPEVMTDFIKTLHNNLDKVSCKNSILLLSLWLPLTWKYKVESHRDSSIQDRVCSLSSLQKQPIFLKSLNEETALKLVAFWIEKLTNSQSTNPYHPFAENDIREFAKNNPTPRQLWQWCAANWLIIVKPDPNPRLQVERMYEELQAKEYFQLMNEDGTIANALLFGFEQIVGETVENVFIKNIKPSKSANAKFQFIIEGIENDQQVFIGVGVCQSNNARTVGAMLTRLMNYSEYNLTRGCLVRSEDKKINPTAIAFKNRQELVSPPLNGEVVNLKYEEIKQLYDLEQVANKANKIDINPRIVWGFIREKTLENQLIQEILSDPSGATSNRVSTSSEKDVDEEFDEEKYISVIKSLIIEVYDEPIELISYYSENGSITGLFLEIERNWIFDYKINFDPTSVVYRPHKFIAELPDEKMEILPQLAGQEITALIDLILFSENFGGSVTILTDDDFEDEDLALEEYGFYPMYEELTPLLYYKSGSLSIDNETVAIGAYLFWGESDKIGSFSDVFVNDDIDASMSNFESFDEAIEYASKRIAYYLEEA
jgi:hypothetical protein